MTACTLPAQCLHIKYEDAALSPMARTAGMI